MKGNDKYIKRYPKKDLVHILKNSGYHSSEWEETDPEEDWTVVSEEATAEATKKKTTSLYIEALEKFSRPTNNVPNYDPEGEDKDIEDIEDEKSDHQNDESDNNIAESSRKKKKKKKQKRRKEKEKQKRKEKQTKTRK